MGNRRRLRPAMVALLAASSLTAACGARWTDEQAEQVSARGAGSVELASGGPAAGETGPAGAIGPGGTGARSGGATPTGTSDPAASVGGSGGRGPAADPGPGRPEEGGALPCAAPSDAPGVTDGEIAIGTINSLSGPVPGLAASSAAAARAYVAHRNASGGVCGRRIVLREADDGTDGGRYRSVLNELQGSVFGIAGGFALGDVGGVDLIRASGIPIVNSPSGQAVADLPSVIDIVPNAERSAKYRYIRENGGTKATLVYLAVDQSRFEADLQRRLMEAEGIRVVQTQELPLSTLSYDAAARKAANSGADYLFFIGDANSNASMARAVAGTGHRFAFFEIFTFAYGSNFVDAAGSAAEGVVSWLRTLPNEDAGANEEVARFDEWMQRVAPGEARDPFAADSWAAAKAFYDTLEALPGPITREAFVQQITGVDAYDADGFFGTIRLGREVADGCQVAMRVEGGTWKRLTPATGFLC